VIVPAWNAAHSLSVTLDSVTAQTWGAHEVIVVDDGSTDNTGDVARRHGHTVLCLEQAHEGQGAARNRGLQRAGGEFVAFLDADDYWMPRFLEESVSFLDRHQEAVAVSCGSLTKTVCGSETVGPPCLALGDAPVEAVVLDDFYHFWAEQDHVRTGTAVVRRSLIGQVGGQREDLRISQDLEYWGYLATFGDWGFIPEPLWVGNSRARAHASGWRKKYEERRRMCPTVEAWQERILPRVTEAQMPYFRVVRGRVAAGYAHAKILGGDRAGARHIVRTFGCDFPRNRVTRLMRMGGRCSGMGWGVVCTALSAREALKS